MEEVEIPHSTSSGQALRQAQGRLSGDAGMTGVCSVGRADVSSFWPNVFSFDGNVSTLAADVSSFRRGAWVGAGVAVGVGAVAGRDGGGAEVFARSGEWGSREHQPISELPIDADNQAIKALWYWLCDWSGAVRPRESRRSIPGRIVLD